MPAEKLIKNPKVSINLEGSINKRYWYVKQLLSKKITKTTERKKTQMLTAKLRYLISQTNFLLKHKLKSNPIVNNNTKSI